MKSISRKSCKIALGAVALLGLTSFTLINEETIASTRELVSESRFLKRAQATDSMPPRTELIWLMSFPGAGSEQIINAIEAATGVSMGTNYGHKMQTLDFKVHMNKFPSMHISEDLYRRGPRGPFWNNVDRPPSTGSVIVNTHCTGYCLTSDDDTGRCGRSGYIRTLIPSKRFYMSCYRSKSFDPARKPKTSGIQPYWRAKVKKVIVIVRNPFDMIASRFYKSGEKDFGAYCAFINERWGKMREIRTAKETKLKDIDADSIPCYPEFFRIFHWYNNAYTIAKKKESIMVRFEDLQKVNKKNAKDDVKKNMNRILDFAGLEKMQWFRQFLFIHDKVAHSTMWTPEQRVAVKDFMHALNGPAMMKAYFTDYLNKNLK